MVSDKTMNFKVDKDKNNRAKDILKEVYQALVEKAIIQSIKLLDIFYLVILLILRAIMMQEI